MQLTLAFLKLPPPAQQPPSQQLDAEAHAKTIELLARIVAQAFETSEQTEATDE